MKLEELKNVIKDNMEVLQNNSYLEYDVSEEYGEGLSDHINEVIEVVVDGVTCDVLPFQCDDCNYRVVYYSVNVGDMLDMLREDGEILETSDGEVCKDCSERYCFCTSCDEYHVRDYGIIDADGNFYCERCSNDCLFYCSMCNEYYNRDRHHHYYVEDYNESICEGCYQNSDVICCYDCGYYYGRDYVICDDGAFCEDCYSNHEHHAHLRISDQLKDANSNDNEIVTFDSEEMRACSGGHLDGYHDYRRSFVKYHTDGEDANSSLFLGVELECEDSSGYKYKMIEYLERKSMRLIGASDGSLNDGIEFVSDPQTMGAWMERKESVYNMLNFLSMNDFKSHDTTTCGLHIHASKKALGNNAEEIADTIARIDLLLESFKDNIIVFSRRKESELSRWARFVSDYTDDKESVFSTELLKLNKRTGDRYQALNLDNTHTIEFRFFKGTLKPTTFYASIQLINNIIEVCKNPNLFNNNLKWIDIINLNDYEELKSYNELLSNINDKATLNDRTLSIRKEQEKKDKKTLKKVYIQKIKLDEIVDFLDANVVGLMHAYNLRNNFDYTMGLAIRNPLNRTDDSDNDRITKLIMEVGNIYSRLINYKNDRVRAYKTLSGINYYYYENDDFKELMDTYEDLKNKFSRLLEKGVF